MIIVEEETGNRYVYAGGTLYPAHNQASALLLQGTGASVEVISAARSPACRTARRWASRRAGGHAGRR